MKRDKRQIGECGDFIYAQTHDLDLVVELEQNTWIPPLQASRETISQRIYARHFILLHTQHQQQLPVAAVCWFYTHLSCFEPVVLPYNFNEFSKRNACSENTTNAAYIYNLGTHFNFRRKGIGTETLAEALKKIRQNGIQDVFLDGRCPSYNGSQHHIQENILPVPEFKKAMNSAFRKGNIPTIDEAQLDPILRFYLHQGFRPFALRHNFYPADIPSGTFRIILHQHLP
jgi:ribosomal protein S18 acetylase RimI-like enzyme